MESLEVMENGVGSCNGGMESLEVRRNGAESCNGVMEQRSNGVKESDHLDVDILEDLESYMQDVNDRLTISRMVSDSVIKGMVTAVTEEAAEEIAQKEREVTKLKEMLHVHHVAVDENELSGSSVMLRESTGIQHGLARIGSRDGIQQPSSREAFAGHDRIAETLVHLRGTTNEEFKKLRKEIDSIRRHGSMKRISSGSGLGDILQDKVSDRWDVERTLDSLKTTIESVYQQVEEMIHFSASVYEWQLEQEFKAKIEAEIEAFVTGNCIWTVRGNMRVRFCDVKNLNWDGKMKEISDIRDELSAISKSLTVSDNGQLSSHESLGGEEESSSGKKGAASHHKVLNYLKSASSLPSTITTAAATISPSASSLWEENGIHDEIEINMEEHLDPVLLKHMNKEELISHCKNEITKLKRNHELKIQDLTEQHFSHRRELLRERGPSLILKKNKEFEMLGKRISEVISKVDEILVEKEEVDTLLTHTFGSNEESLSSLKDKVESLLSENHQLRLKSDRHKADIFKLEQKLEVAVQELRQVEEDRRMLLDVNQEKQVAVSLLEAKKRELSEQFESIAVYVSGLLKSFNDFECRVTQEISGRCSRLKSLTSQSHVLQQKADVLVRRGLLYKQRFEKKCADLEKAEAEVDLLGDEVETLLNLVEKLYIGLDHYSPILQHYPGITEILKLLKRELSPEN